MSQSTVHRLERLLAHFLGGGAVMYRGSRQLHLANAALVLKRHVVVRREADARPEDTVASEGENAEMLAVHFLLGSFLVRGFACLNRVQYFSMHARCLKRALTTGARGGTKGACHRQNASGRLPGR